jgi:hypothetical protein
MLSSCGLSLILVWSYDALRITTSTRFVVRRSIRLGYSQYIGLSTGAQEAIIKAETRSLFFGDERIISSEAVKIEETAGRLFITIAVFVRDRQDPIVVTEEVA